MEERADILVKAIEDLKIKIEHAYDRGCSREHPQVKRFWFRLERYENELKMLKERK
jgi:hypothetical protein